MFCDRLLPALTFTCFEIYLFACAFDVTVFAVVLTLPVLTTFFE